MLPKRLARLLNGEPTGNSMRRLFAAFLVAVILLGGDLIYRAWAQTNTFCANNLACTVTAAWGFTQQITSSVSTGTAPFSIASTSVVANLNSQFHNGLTAPGSAIVGVSDTQALTNKTLDVSANTLKTSTNTAGHYPRNNGTQYVDNTIQAADVPVFIASGASHAPGAVPDPGASAGTTHFLREDATWATLPASGVSETVVSGTVTSGVCASGSPSNCAVVFVPANAHTLTRLVSVVTTAGSGCSANSQWAIIDLSNSNAVLASGTPSNIVGTVTDSGALSVSMTAGHRFALGQANNPTGCTTFEAAIISANYQ